jgi:hypothetical protein
MLPLDRSWVFIGKAPQVESRAAAGTGQAHRFEVQVGCRSGFPKLCRRGAEMRDRLLTEAGYDQARRHASLGVREQQDRMIREVPQKALVIGERLDIELCAPSGVTEQRVEGCELRRVGLHRLHDDSAPLGSAHLLTRLFAHPPKQGLVAEQGHYDRPTWAAPPFFFAREPDRPFNGGQRSGKLDGQGEGTVAFADAVDSGEQRSRHVLPSSRENRSSGKVSLSNGTVRPDQELRQARALRAIDPDALDVEPPFPVPLAPGPRLEYASAQRLSRGVPQAALGDAGLVPATSRSTRRPQPAHLDCVYRRNATIKRQLVGLGKKGTSWILRRGCARSKGSRSFGFVLNRPSLLTADRFAADRFAVVLFAS